MESNVFIKINLLPQDLRPRKSWMILDYRAFIVLAFIAVTIFLATYYLDVQRKLNNVQSELKMWKNAEIALQPTIDLQNEVNKLREDVKKRVVIIKDLTQDSNLRFSMLQHINNVLPGNSWLFKIAETVVNNKITYTIEGMSYMKKDVSLFIAELEKYENFENVSLESIKPAPLDVRDAYVFSVKVVLKSLKLPEESEKDDKTAKASDKGAAGAKAPAKKAAKK
jgi:Tfp pilus assembly protein PilN